MAPRRRSVVSKTRAKNEGHGEDDPTTSHTASSLATSILDGIQQRANPQTKAWFTNYVKGTTWIGCKMPAVREAVQAATGHKSKKKPCDIEHDILLDAAIALLRQEACDVKLAGMLLLSEQMAIKDLATQITLQRLEDEVLLQNKVDDWSSADWFALKVLQKIVFYEGGSENDNAQSLAKRVLNYTNVADKPDHNYLYVRRCGVVPFLDYHKHRDMLPPKFGMQLVDACERSLLTSPEERFTQTGIAWVLRYVLLQKEEKDQGYQMIVRHGPLWTKEAKKSLAEKLSKTDSRRRKILELE